MSYPNIEALAQGCMSGSLSEWPALKREAREFVADYEQLQARCAELEAEARQLRIENANTRALKTDRERELEAEKARQQERIDRQQWVLRQASNELRRVSKMGGRPLESVVLILGEETQSAPHPAESEGK